MSTIYLDNAATAWPKAPTVAAAVASFITHDAVNTGRGAYDRAYETAGRIDECREKLAALFGASDSRNVTFALNVTHAINTLTAGLFTPSDHVLVSAMEHNAVMRPVFFHEIIKSGHWYKFIAPQISNLVFNISFFPSGFGIHEYRLNAVMRTKTLETFRYISSAAFDDFSNNGSCIIEPDFGRNTADMLKYSDHAF